MLNRALTMPVHRRGHQIRHRGGQAMHHAKNKDETVKLEPYVRGYLGARLRAAYQNLDEQPVPAEQIDLLLALRHKERERKRKV